VTIHTALPLKALIPPLVFGFDHIRLQVFMMHLNTTFIKIRQFAGELSLLVFPKVSARLMRIIF